MESLPPKPVRRFIVRAILTVVVSFIMLLLAAIYFWFSFQTWLSQPLRLPAEGLRYELDAGKTLSHVTQDLASKNLLDHPRWLTWYARYYNKQKIHAGEYLLTTDLTPVSLLEKLNKGDVVLHQFTLLEGWNFKQVLSALDQTQGIRHLLSNKDMSEQLTLLNLPISHPEGWFAPDTYSYFKGMTDVDILSQAFKITRKYLDGLWQARSSTLPYASDYQALIMASIIEKETGSNSEREKIAGVFVRRLQQGMKLQTDPTVIYGMGDAYAGKITRDDLARPTPYNTYAIDGLPPTPIAAPSKASLYAAFHPDSAKTLYFVAKGDGTSEFSETLAEHQRAVARYQLQRAADYRASPK